VLAIEDRRWELYKLLGEPLRLRLLALANAEELNIGELAEVLDESQPNVSRRLKPLREMGLVRIRKEGTRVFVSLDSAAAQDTVVADALREGQRLCQEDGSLARVAAVVRARDEAARALFESGGDGSLGWPEELGAYLSAIAPLITRRELAIDVGTGDGGLLEVLAPLYAEVVGVDRSARQLERAKARLAHRGYTHVRLLQAEVDALDDLRGRADAVFAARVLHHAPKPKKTLEDIAALLAPGGALLVIDYVAHDDERMREEHADTWLGFAPDELRSMARAAGLSNPSVNVIHASRCGGGPDGHLDWQVLAARRPE